MDDPTRLTNWSAIRDFVPTARKDTYPYISPSSHHLSSKSVFPVDVKREILATTIATGSSSDAEDAVVLTFAMDVLVVNARRCETIAEKDAGGRGRRGRSTCTSAFLPLVLRSASSRTVIVTASAGAHMLSRNLQGYQTSKFVLCRVVEYLARGHARDGLAMTQEWRKVFDQNPRLAGDTYAWIARERREWLSGRFVSATWDMEELVVRREDILRSDLLKFRLTV
ncbi:hypothetical protein F4810DRAFT_706314 [Camillea tinctor]|nr:hypothetical protein F4810DRAFT_706314 [Camillea tinctor]